MSNSILQAFNLKNEGLKKYNCITIDSVDILKEEAKFKVEVRKTDNTNKIIIGSVIGGIIIIVLLAALIYHIHLKRKRIGAEDIEKIYTGKEDLIKE